MLQSEGVGLMVWSPLAGGLLSGKYEPRATAGRRTAAGANFDFPPVDKRPRLRRDRRDAADRRSQGCTVAQVALAWLLHQRVVTSVIIGAKRPEQLQDNLGAVDVALDADGSRRARRGQPARRPNIRAG